MHFSLCPYPLVLSLSTSEKSLALPSVLSPHQIFIHIDKIPLSILFCRLNHPSSFSFTSYKRCSSPLMIFVALDWTCSSESVSLELGRKDCREDRKSSTLHACAVQSSCILLLKHCTHLQVVQTDETARKPDHIPVSSEDERNAIFQLEKSIVSNEALESE